MKTVQELMDDCFTEDQNKRAWFCAGIASCAMMILDEVEESGTWNLAEKIDAFVTDALTTGSKLNENPKTHP
jgi:hypothetical protein